MDKDVDAADLELNQALEADTRGDDEPATNAELRQMRIDEYEDLCLSRDDPFAAGFGAATADLQRIQAELAKAVIGEIKRQPGSLERFIELKREVKSLIDIHHAIELDHHLMKEYQLVAGAGSSAAAARIGGRNGIGARLT